MTTRIWTKKETQACIKEMRAAGYPVKKKHDGFYQLRTKDGRDIFTAMRGNNGYLIRYVDGLFVEGDA